MATSQNGWTTITGGELDRTLIAGVALAPGVRKGAVAVVLHYVAQQFHNRVEPLVAGWCWGYNYRVIAGKTELSNHSSGTAIDLNAPRHPMGKGNTFNAEQVKAIRAFLGECEGVVRWGGDYAYKDEMHFEINALEAEIKRLAAKLSGQPAPDPAPSPAPKPVPEPKKQTVFLPSSQDTWRLYDVGTDPVAGREKAMLRPSKFPPGLTYEILGWHNGGATVEIQTNQFGRGKVYVKGTVAQINAKGVSLPAPPSKPTETVKPGTWFVRSAPRTFLTRKLGHVKGGERYQTTKVGGGWRKINFNGQTGYVGPSAW